MTSIKSLLGRMHIVDALGGGPSEVLVLLLAEMDSRGMGLIPHSGKVTGDSLESRHLLRFCARAAVLLALV